MVGLPYKDRKLKLKIITREFPEEFENEVNKILSKEDVKRITYTETRLSYTAFIEYWVVK